MKKIFTLSAFSLLLSAKVARAFCPVCTVAAASAVGLSRWIGVDDTISGLWIGALTVSTIGWTINWLAKKKNVSSMLVSSLVSILYYGLIIIPFYQMNLISFHPVNMLWGIDKLLLGIVIGSIFFLLAHMAYLTMKRKNGKPHFPFEKIALPIGTNLVLSIVFYFLTK